MKTYIYFIIFFFLSTVGYAQDGCINQSIIELLKKELIAKIEENNLENINDLVNSLVVSISETETTEYNLGVSKLIENGVSCQEITSWSIVEVYSFHSLIHRAYLCAESNTGMVSISAIDLIEESANYLGAYNTDYFGRMARLIIPRSSKGVGEDYIFSARITKSGNIDCSIASNSSIFEINELFIIEELLKLNVE
jgi:hypothetical protein